jgi:putative acetyltransferase
LDGGDTVEIRSFHASDIDEIVTLFFDTVHTINRRDYSQEQLDAWAPAEEMKQRVTSWAESMSLNTTYVAVVEDIIVGFSDMTDGGHLYRLFVHKDYQGLGIASALVEKLEAEAVRRGLTELDTDASITARPFFERRGYRVVSSQEAVRQGITLRNYKMMKALR